MTQKHAILGFGVTGQSVARHLLANAKECMVFDTRPSRLTPKEFEQLAIHWQIADWSKQQMADQLGTVDRVVVSPGIELDLPILEVAREMDLPIVSDIDLFFEATTAPVIGVTGTNGKSTVVSLVGHILNRAGKTCGVGGNIGHAALDLLGRPPSCYVLELSSFQLERSASLPLVAASVLNVSEDHLDHHGSLQNYQQAKLRIYDKAQHRVFNRQDPVTTPNGSGRSSSFGVDAPDAENAWGVIQASRQNWIARGDEPIVAVNELPLLGNHNVLNIMAAFALVESQVEARKAVSATAEFEPLDHRFQRVGQLGDVIYIDDSKATNVGATLAALQGLAPGTKVVLIGGGDAKGADLSVLRCALSNFAVGVVALGKDAEALLAVAHAAGVAHRHVENMTAAVAVAREMSTGADMVLLSPACSSLDMFQNFVERGQVFAGAVRALGAESVAGSGVS